MKPATQNSSAIGKTCAVILFGALTVTTIACSSNTKTAKLSSQINSPVKTAVLQTSTAPPAPQLEPVVAKKVAVDRSAEAKLITFKSRDYGVSFVYPRQYAYLSAKTIANGGDALMPRPDGSDGQFTLARIDVPKGFYPDTNFESGYFILSLNQDLGQEDCEATLGPEKAETENINGMDFRWVETENGGRGSASKIRNYVAFANSTCYEVEVGVKTKSEKGMAREVNPDQAMSRLDGVLKTLTIKASAKPAAVDVKSASVTQN